LNGAIIGSVNDPQLLSARVKVPRGQVTFQQDFIDELKALLARGSIALSEAVTALGGNGRKSAEIVRNLAFLVAGGALSPFAKVYRHALPAEVRRPANSLVERTLAFILESSTTRAIPSELLGNGIPVKPAEALAIVELLAGSDVSSIADKEVARHVAQTLLPNLARLQLVI
jgi:hypothetical protein